jgi:hypothetical protein
MMKYIPILFSTEMVHAILAGRKKMTRRTNGLEALNVKGYKPVFGFGLMGYEVNDEIYSIKRPYEIGDILWVRESFAPDYFDNHDPAYKADWNKTAAEYVNEPKWKPSIFMPKEACRTWLKVTDVRVERLQDITQQDAVDEGIEHRNERFKNYDIDEFKFSSPISSFISLWVKINGKESWDANPWVWVVSFERCERPENFLITK